MNFRKVSLAAVTATLALAAPSAAQANTFPLVGWWPMNEGSGQTVRDWSGRGNHGFLGSTTAVDDNDPSWIRGRLPGLRAALRRRRLRHDPGHRASRSSRRT